MEEFAKYAKQRVIALQSKIKGARDGMQEARAAQNMIEDKAAFGWSCSYSNAPAGTFCATVNERADIEAAQIELAPFFANNGRDSADPKWLDYLLPLNKEAVMMLVRAYQNAGLIITSEELRDRTASWELEEA